MDTTFFHHDPALASLGDRILTEICADFPPVSRDRIAFTWIVYDPPVLVNTGGALSAAEFWKHKVRGCSHRGEARIYPASIVKLFYLVATYEWLETGMLQSSPELERAMRDAIVDSSNDATSLIVDMLTGTTSGPELSDGPARTWETQRNIVNRYFASLGWEEFKAINVNQKTWCDGPYGRERNFVGANLENRNMLTTNATSRLLHSIIGGVAVSARASQSLMNLMQRSLDPQELAANPENQVTGFLGGGLPQTALVWSKAGLTSQVRHDAAYIELPDRQPYLLVVFAEGKEQSQSETLLPAISRKFADAVATL